MRRRRRRKRRRIFSIASLKIFEEETSSSSEEEEEEGAFLESGFEVSLGVCVVSKSSSSSRDDDVDDAFVTDRTGTPPSSSSSVVDEEEEDEKEEEEEFVVRLSYAFDISNALVRSRLGRTNDKENENNEDDKDEEEVLKTMVFTLKEERFTYEQKGNNDNGITLSVDAREMQKILERVPLRVKENTACVFVETMKPREDDTPTKTPNTRDDTTKKYIVDDRVTVVAKHFRCEETGKLKRQFVNPFV